MKTKKENFANKVNQDQQWTNFGIWWEKQYNILMNELYGIKWVDTKWIFKRLLVVLILGLFFGICKRIFELFNSIMPPL